MNKFIKRALNIVRYFCRLVLNNIIILGFILDMRRLIAYLVPGWYQKFVDEMLEVESSSTAISIGNVRRLGGKAIRVVCIFGPLRAYCNGIFACLRSLKQGRKLSFAHQRLFRQDIGVIRNTLEGAPSVRLLCEPTKLASIADGALHVDTDASTKWRKVYSLP